MLTVILSVPTEVLIRGAVVEKILLLGAFIAIFIVLGLPMILILLGVLQSIFNVIQNL